MTFFEFVAKHGCTKYEIKRLAIRLAEIRYEKTLDMLAKVMRA